MAAVRFGFPSLLRLSEKTAFRRVFRSAKRLSADSLVVLFLRNDLEQLRLGVVTSKKNIRFAVARNRFRRVVKESVRLHQDDLRGLDLVVIAKKGADKVTKAALRQCIDQQWTSLAGLRSNQ